MANILVTGAAGFIGFHLCGRLLQRGDTVTGLDNLNDYYDVQLKQDRLAQLEGRRGFTFLRADLADRARMEQAFRDHDFDIVVNLAAQAGVRYSLTNPHAYVDSNLVGFVNILEGCRHSAGKTPGLCVVEFRLRCQHPDAVLRAPQRRPSGQPVCRHEEGE